MASIRTNVMCVLFAGAAVAAACGTSERKFGGGDGDAGASGATGVAGDAAGGSAGDEGVGGRNEAGGAGTSGASGGATGLGGGAGTTATGGSAGSPTAGSGGNVTGGEGGVPTAGAGGVVTAGAGGTAGSAGAAGTPGMGGSAGVAGTAGTGGSAGGAGTAGTPGSGGTAGVAGEAGGGGSTGCTVTGIEANHPNDGIDNDCNGNIDIPVLTSAFPELGKAAAGADVQLTFETPAVPGAVFECRRFKPGTSPLPAFGACDTDGQWLSVEPFNVAQSAIASQNGLWQTDVRIAFPSGEYSDVLPWSYYTHNSMHGVARCAPPATDELYFAKAAERLIRAGVATFAPGDVQLANPFIHIVFSPSLNNSLAVSYENHEGDGRGQVVTGDGVADVMSLRKRFVLNSDGTLLLMTRVYAGRRTDVCSAGSIKTHDRGIYPDYDNNNFHIDRCHAMVWNKHGAGECLNVDSSGNVQFNTTHQLWLTGIAPNQQQHPLPYPVSGEPAYFAGPDNFMWRKLLRTGPANSEPYRQSRLFSPKCDVAGCQAGSQALYLPDRALF